MRLRWIVAFLLIAFAAAWAWPYAGAYALAGAAERGDQEAVARQVDFPALRRSLAHQIVRAYLAQSGKGDKLNGLGRTAAVAVGSTVADPYLKDLLTPDTITALLGKGHLDSVKVGDRTVSLNQSIPPLSGMLGDRLASVLLHSYYDGVGRFVFNVRAPDTQDEVGVHLALSGLTWRLAGLDLPSSTVDRIVTDIIARQKADARS